MTQKELDKAGELGLLSGDGLVSLKDIYTQELHYSEEERQQILEGLSRGKIIFTKKQEDRIREIFADEMQKIEDIKTRNYNLTHGKVLD